MNCFVHLGTGLPVIELDGNWYAYETVIDDSQWFYVASYEPQAIPEPDKGLLRRVLPEQIEVILGIPRDRVERELRQLVPTA